LLEKQYTAVHVCAKRPGKSGFFQTIISASLSQESNEQGIIFSEQRVSVKFAVFFWIVLGVWNSGLRE
jgi:hypothetical protein